MSNKICTCKKEYSQKERQKKKHKDKEISRVAEKQKDR